MILASLPFNFRYPFASTCLPVRLDVALGPLLRRLGHLDGGEAPVLSVVCCQLRACSGSSLRSLSRVLVRTRVELLAPLSWYSLCPLLPFLPIPARSRAWSSLRQVRTPKMTGVPESSWTRMRPCETASQMYSKCIVEPLIRTPMEMTASKGCLLAAALSPAGVEVPVPSPSTRERRLVVLMSELAPEACVLPPSMSLIVSLNVDHLTASRAATLSQA